METKTSHLFEFEKTNCPKEQLKNSQKYIYHYYFDIKYEILNSIIKDIQMISQLIQSIKDHQINDLIFTINEDDMSILFDEFGNMIAPEDEPTTDLTGEVIMNDENLEEE